MPSATKSRENELETPSMNEARLEAGKGSTGRRPRKGSPACGQRRSLKSHLAAASPFADTVHEPFHPSQGRPPGVDIAGDKLADIETQIVHR